MEEHGRLTYRFLTGPGKAPECVDLTNMQLNRWGATMLTSNVVKAQIREAALSKEQAAAESEMKRAEREVQKQQRAAEKQRKRDEKAAKKALRLKAKEDKLYAAAAKKKKKQEDRAAANVAERAKAMDFFNQGHWGAHEAYIRAHIESVGG